MPAPLAPAGIRHGHHAQSIAPQEQSLRQQSAPRLISGEGAYWVMVAPLLAFVVAIAIYPLLFSFRISLFKYRLTDPNQVQTFIGLDNYARAMQDPTVLSALQVTLVYVAGTVILEGCVWARAGAVADLRGADDTLRAFVSANPNGAAAAGGGPRLEVALQRRLWRHSLLPEATGRRCWARPAGRTQLGHAGP